MKRLALIWVMITFIMLNSQAQTTAIDFTLTDCDGISHSLYPILDSGNVGILVYEHQCASCVAGTGNLKTTINTYFSTQTNLRVMYMDNGGYPCSSTKTWITSHGYIPGPAFAYSSNQSSPYGAGMPVIVVTGTKAHKVYIIANNSSSATYTNVPNLKNAIQNALTDISLGINPESGNSATINIFPNPANNDQVKINLSNSNIKILRYEISNTSGQIVLTSTALISGITEESINISDFENGIYFFSLHTTEGIIVKKLAINR